MKTIILLVVLAAAFAGCSTFNRYPNRDACVLLYNMETKKYEEIYGQARCEKRVLTGSLFKIPLSLMAYDSGLLKNENQPVFKWDKTRKPFIIEPWNQDHTPDQWMKRSVVWVSQELTTSLGMEKLQAYLDKFNYGNRDFSGGIRTAWHPEGKVFEDEGDSSLKISGFEQVTFMEKFWKGELGVKPEATQYTKNILEKIVSPNGAFLIGKTAHGSYDEAETRRIGGYAAVLTKDNAHYIVIVHFNDTKPEDKFNWGGMEAKNMALDLLKSKSLW